MVQLPLSSAEIDTPNRRGEARNIMLANEPDRDRELDEVCQLIERCAQAGIPAAKYNLNIIGIPRSEREAGRGGSSNSTFRWDKVDQDADSTSAGDVSEDEFWERIDHFLGRRRPRCRVEPGPARLPSPRPLHAARLPRRDPRAGHGRRPQEVRGDARKPVPRPELLPGHRVGDAGRPGRGDLRRHSVLR